MWKEICKAVKSAGDINMMLCSPGDYKKQKACVTNYNRGIRGIQNLNDVGGEGLRKVDIIKISIVGS